MKQKIYEQVVKRLNDIRNMDRRKWGIFFLGSQLCLGQKRIYVHRKVARKRIMENIMWSVIERTKEHPYGIPVSLQVKIERANNIIDELEKSGVLEFRKIGDRGAKFPKNIKGIDLAQAEKFEKMLDAPDDEMCKLAITVLENISKEEKEIV